MPLKAAVRREGGLMMIEVLITILIVSLGLLGIAAMFVRSQLVSDEAYQRYVALQLARQLTEQLSANAQQAALAQASAYVTGVNGAAIAGDAGFAEEAACGPCGSLQMARRDLTVFHQAIVGAQKIQGANRISALVDARGCVEYLGPAAGAPPNALDPPRYRVSVVWQGRQASAESVNATACGNAVYGTGLRRVVSLEVDVL